MTNTDETKKIIDQLNAAIKAAANNTEKIHVHSAMIVDAREVKSKADQDAFIAAIEKVVGAPTAVIKIPERKTEMTLQEEDQILSELEAEVERQAEASIEAFFALEDTRDDYQTMMLHDYMPDFDDDGIDYSNADESGVEIEREDEDDEDYEAGLDIIQGI